MNAVEIEQAVSLLAEAPFDAASFPFAFLEAFGNKDTTLKRLRTGGTNQSDLPGGVLQRNNIHLKVCAEGHVPATLAVLRESPATARQKAKFILATDGVSFEAENLADGETVACLYPDFHDHFGFFLPLAGITTVRQIRENAFDIKATSRLNRLYVTLLKENPKWDTGERREDLNHFMARLIFCFFAEDTAIFGERARFTATVEQMTAGNYTNTHEVLAELFRSMNTKLAEREAARIPSWANGFPYVNGGLFGSANGSADVLVGTFMKRANEDVGAPIFSKIARSYLLHVGGLDWTKINPDIFGSMIQAVADDAERGALGMHYTSVPNILKVLNPLFLDDLRARLAEAAESPQKLLNLRKRMARIRVFDPACGSGNFLVIAYKEMRAIEAEVNRRRGEADRPSEIPLTNYRGIELRHFSAEIARLALIIAEYQCDVLYRGQKLALLEFLPLEAANWITCGNALRLDWLSICPPTGKGVKVRGDDLFLGAPTSSLAASSHDANEDVGAPIDFVNEGGETYICGNPPYLGSTWQSDAQKSDLKSIFEGRTKSWKSLDYVAGWFMKAADYGTHTKSAAAFVSTNSICQGQQVPILWPLIFETGHEIHFAHTSFKWANLASHNAGVTVVIVGMSKGRTNPREIFTMDTGSVPTVRQVATINGYLVVGPDIIIQKIAQPLDGRASVDAGGKPVEGGHLLLSDDEKRSLLSDHPQASPFLKRAYGASEYIKGTVRHCLWITDECAEEASKIAPLRARFEKVATFRRSSPKVATQKGAEWPHRFEEMKQSGDERVLIIPKVSSESREYLPVGLLPQGSIVTDLAFALYDAPLWNMALIASRLHLIWIATVCGKLETRYRYSNTLGWNTFPVPPLTEQNKADLTRCAEDILLAREAHFPATIADLYGSANGSADVLVGSFKKQANEDVGAPMPANLRAAHDRNDETLERIYLGRRFKNDTERLETLFALYTEMTGSANVLVGMSRKTRKGGKE